MKIILISLFFLLSSIVCFCQTQMEMNQETCSSYKKADTQMTVAYKKVLKSLENAIQKQGLIKTQKAWIIYKEAHCKSIAALYEGGSIQPMIYCDCFETLTKERTKNLQFYLENK